MGLLVVGPVDGFCDITQVFLHVIAIDDLEGTGKQFLGNIPDVGGSVSQHNGSRRLLEAATHGLTQDSLRKLGRIGIGVSSGRAFNGRRITHGSLVTNGYPILVLRFGTPDGDQFDLASFGRTIFLLARAAE